jgi:hypothetical protein
MESSILKLKSTEPFRRFAGRFLDGEPPVLGDFIEDDRTSSVSIGLLASPIAFVLSPLVGASSPLKPSALPPKLPSEPVANSSEESRRLLAGRLAGVGNADAMLYSKFLLFPPVFVALFTPSCYPQLAVTNTNLRFIFKEQLELQLSHSKSIERERPESLNEQWMKVPFLVQYDVLQASPTSIYQNKLPRIEEQKAIGTSSSNAASCSGTVLACSSNFFGSGSKQRRWMALQHVSQLINFMIPFVSSSYNTLNRMRNLADFLRFNHASRFLMILSCEFKNVLVIHGEDVVIVKQDLLNHTEHQRERDFESQARTSFAANDVCIPIEGLRHQLAKASWFFMKLERAWVVL